MSIAVHCAECGKTYQVRDTMAGRRGKCPRGHSISVPAVAEPLAEENAFAFTSGPAQIDQDDDAPALTTARRRPAPEPEPEPAADADDFSAFPTKLAGSTAREEDAPAPRTGRHSRPDRKAAGKEGKPSLIPLILGGILAVLGIGGGTTLLIVSRGEAGPLQEQAEAANKKAAAAEERAQKAESLRLVAESEMEKLKKNPPRDPAVADLQSKLKAAEKRATEAEKQVKGLQSSREGGGVAAMPDKELDPSAPGGKNDPVMPGGKLEADRPGKKKEMEKKDAKKEMDKKDAPTAGNIDDIPLGGKNWTVPGSIMLGKDTLKGGDRIWLWPQEDVAPKGVGGKLTIKFRWQLRKGKQIPETVGVALMVQEARQIRTLATRAPLTGAGGENEITFDVKDFKGNLPVYFFIGNGSAQKPEAYSSMLSFQVDFGPAAK